MNQSRYIVTGAAGFIGTHLSRALVDAGAAVLGLDDFSSSSPRHAAIAIHSRYEYLQTDVTVTLRESEWPLQFLEGKVTGIFHLACPASPVDYSSRQITTLRCGALGTEAVLDLAVRRRARVVIASTSEVYGNPNVHPQTEDYWGNVNPIGPRSMYDEAKRYGEALAFAYKRERGANIGIARLFNTYGPGMREDDGRLIPTFIRQALRGEPLTVHGDGRQTRSFCHVSDTVAALQMLMNARDESGPINIGNPVEQTVLSVAERVIDVAGGGSVGSIPRPVDDPDRRRPSIDLAKSRLGWHPVVAFDDGIKETYDAMAECQ